MEARAVVGAGRGEREEVGSRARDLLAVDLELQVAEGRTRKREVERERLRGREGGRAAGGG